MKYSFLMLGGCMGTYTTAKCTGRVADTLNDETYVKALVTGELEFIKR